MGFYDFAGSGVVHVSGGIHALIGKIMHHCFNCIKIYELYCNKIVYKIKRNFQNLFSGSIVLGPRMDRFRDESSKYISGHSIPLISLGGFILIFGFFAFNAGSQV